MPIPTTPSNCGVTQVLGLLLVLFDLLALTRFNWLWARSRVLFNIELPMESNNLLTTASQSYRLFTILLEVNVKTANCNT